MKEIKIIFVVLMIALPIWGVYRYVENMSPVWEITAAQQAAIDLAQRQKDAQTDIEVHAQRSRDWTDAQRVFLWGVIIGVGGWIVIAGWGYRDKRKESWARPVDGQYALQQFSNGSVTWQVDINKSLTGNAGFQKATGLLGEFSSNYAGPDRQLAYAQGVQKTRTASATSGQDGIRNSAQAKLAAGFYDKPLRVIEPQQIPLKEEAEIWQPLLLQDAFRQSSPNRWLLGQNTDGVCEYNIYDRIHTGLLGATGTGKSSSTGLLMALNAKKSGMHVIALDGKGGIDWTQHDAYIEAWPTDYTLFGDQIDEIVHKHELRMKEIKLQGVATIHDLDYQLPPMFVVLDEFGFTMQALKAANKKKHDAVESRLSNLMRVSRATGIYFLLISQTAENWPGVIKGNVKGWISYKLGGQQGNAFNAYDLHKLAPNGQFWHDGNVYDSWHTSSKVKVLQKELQPNRTKLLTDCQYKVVDTDTTDTSVQDEGRYRGLDHTPLTDTTDTATDTTGENGHHLDTTDTTRTPLLVGRPVSNKDKALVLKIANESASKTEACNRIWGRKNKTNWKWLHEILPSEVKQ